MFTLTSPLSGLGFCLLRKYSSSAYEETIRGIECNLILCPEVISHQVLFAQAIT